MAAHDPSVYGFINNGGGTLADPVHTRNYDPVPKRVDKKTGKVIPAIPARSLTVRQSDVAAHYKAVVVAALDRNEKANVKASEEAIAEARQWYVVANAECVRIRDYYNGGVDKDGNRLYPEPNANLTLEQVTGVMAAVSPRQRWDQNIISCERVITAYLNNADAKSLDDLKDETGAGLRGNVEIGLKILDGADSSVMTGLKRKSFWNNLMDPTNVYDTTIDGWMASAIWRMGGTFSDGAPVDEKALAWIDHKQTVDGEVAVEGAGYVIMADAVRDVARDLGLAPLEVQAIYWVAVGGGQPNTQMWSDDPRRDAPPKPKWVLANWMDDYPFMRPPGKVEYFRYGHYKVLKKEHPTVAQQIMGQKGTVWQITDPWDVNPKAGFGTQMEFKTKKAAQEWMDQRLATMYADGPPSYVGRGSEPVVTQGLTDKVWAAAAAYATKMGLVASGAPWDELLDEDGGEWCDPTDYDVVAIYDMSVVFGSTSGAVEPLASAWEITGPHPTVGQIRWCWENPDAWDVLGGAVDREWFIEQVMLRVPYEV